MHPQQKLKSISVYVPLVTIERNLSEIGFSIKGSTTIVADGKFWRKMLYSNGNETIRSLKKLVMHTQKIQLLQFVHQTTLFQKL